MCGSPNSSPTTSRPPGFSTRRSSASACSWSYLAEGRDEIGRVEAVVVVRERARVTLARRDVRDTAVAGASNRVFEHLLLEVEDVERPAGRYPLGDVERVVAGARADFEHGLARLRLERLAQARARDERVRRLDPEP